MMLWSGEDDVLNEDRNAVKSGGSDSHSTNGSFMSVISRQMNSSSKQISFSATEAETARITRFFVY